MSAALPRPAEICKSLVSALEAAEGRRRRRKRDQTPDTIGLTIKRDILERVIQEDPPAEEFEEWLLRYCEISAPAESAGAIRAMARTIFDEWRLAHSMNEFKKWLEQGAPSDDAEVADAGEIPLVDEVEVDALGRLRRVKSDGYAHQAGIKASLPDRPGR